MRNGKVEKALLRALGRDPESVNTDWFGTSLISGALDHSRLGHPEAADFAARWLESHIERHRGMAPDDLHETCEGPRCRVIRGGALLIGTYCGYFGISHACKKLFDQTGHAGARQACLDAGDVILHHAARNGLGLVCHDDGERPFTIPDAAFFVIPPLLAAAAFDSPQAPALGRQARVQLKGFADLFFDRGAMLTKTVFRDGRLGKTYWIRATGWLLWAIAESLGYLDRTEPIYGETVEKLAMMAEGLEKYQDVSGGFRLLVDDESAPLETTGSIMIACCVHKAVRCGWLPPKYARMAERAWEYVNSRTDGEGNLSGCYSGWALPAEDGELQLFDRPMDWMQGMLLAAGAEFAT
ncbi:MAG: glycoside hydrolase family 88 protein [Clostridiales bacterium]|jgi:rhamnogalacturonyl hydrolase YesR|nr:glycoside hydrolase family 88 protein [Clostridiales bacterium]